MPFSRFSNAANRTSLVDVRARPRRRLPASLELSVLGTRSIESIVLSPQKGRRRP